MDKAGAEIDRTHSVTRGEFDDFKTQVLGALATVSRKLDEQAKEKQWNFPTIIAVVAVLGAPLAFTVKNLYQGEETARVLAGHLESSERRAAELEMGLGIVRERARALEAADAENATQHRWLADVMNLRADMSHQMDRARVAEDGTIVYPTQSYWPLGGLGGAK